MIQSRQRILGPAIVGGILIFLLVGGMLGYRHFSGNIISWTEYIFKSISGLGFVGVLIFIALLTLIAFTGVFPASLIGVASGTIYGVMVGFPISAVSTMLGAWMSFAISRSMFRGWIEALLVKHPRLKSLDVGLAESNWRMVCLLRISPIMPFALTSYALGLSSVTRRDYTIGTLASMPALFGYVCLGGLARDGFSNGGAGANYLHWALLGFGIIATVALTLKIRRMMIRTNVAQKKL